MEQPDNLNVYEHLAYLENGLVFDFGKVEFGVSSLESITCLISTTIIKSISTTDGLLDGQSVAIVCRFFVSF